MVPISHLFRVSLSARAAWTVLLGLLLLVGISLRLATPCRAQTLPVTTTWLGNTLSRSSTSNPYTYLQTLDSIYVAPDGTVYAHSGWDEGGKCVGIYHNGDPTGSCSCGMPSPPGITGDGTFVYFSSGNGKGYGVQRNLLCGGGNSGYIPVNTNYASITGLAVSGTELFVADQAAGQIKVYQKDFSSPIIKRSWAATQPIVLTGAVAVTKGSAGVVGAGTTFTTALAVGNTILVDGQYATVASIADDTHLTASTNYTVTADKARLELCPPSGAMAADTHGHIWVVQQAIDGHPAQIICTDSRGNNRHQTITDVIDPRGLAVNKAGQLMVCECGPEQNIRIYNISGSGPPGLASTFGSTGGIFGQGTALVGTVALKAGSPAVVGAGTSFTTALAVGNFIYANGQVNRIVSIMDDTHLTVNNAFLWTTNGVTCCRYSSPTMGQAGVRKFNNPMGVGVDSAGNIYVGTSAFTLEAYTAGGTLLWKMESYAAGDKVCSPDPNSETDVFGLFEHYTLDYTQPSGNQWTTTGCTYNPFKYPMDWRLTNASPTSWGCVSICGHRFLAVGQTYDQGLALYRFNAATDGETAIPCAMFTNCWGFRWPPTEPSWANQWASWVWIDTKGNGQMDPSEFTNTKPVAGHAELSRWRIDAQGNVWQTGVFSPTNNNWLQIREWICPTSLSNGVPVYSLANSKLFPVPKYFPGGKCEAPCSIGQNGIEDLNYDPATDTMYLTGFTPANPDTAKENGFNRTPQVGLVLARYNHWSTTPTPAWTTVLPVNTPTGSGDFAKSCTLAGSYLFVGYAFSHSVKVYQTSDGNYVGDLVVGAQCQSGAWIDCVHGLTAYLRSNGEYIVSVEQGYCANQDTLIRWTPTTSAPAAPTGFSSSGYTCTTANLGWTAVSGATGYSLERQEQSTSSPIGWGKWRVLNGSIPAASTSFTDSGLTPGTRYAYRLRAFNAHGASDYSNTVLLDRIDLPFTDHFTGNVLTSPWSITEGNWTEANGILRQSSTIADSTGRCAFVGNAGATYPSDYMIEAKVQVNSSTGGLSVVGVGAHMNIGGAGYGLYFNGAPSTAHLGLVATYFGGSSISFPFTVGTWYWFKLLVKDQMACGKVWQDGTQEPANWLLAQTGWTYYPGGLPALLGGDCVQGSGCSTASFADVSVTDVRSMPAALQPRKERTASAVPAGGK